MKRMNKVISGIVLVAMVIANMPIQNVKAEETDYFSGVIYAQSAELVKIGAKSLSLNGNIVTNGSVSIEAEHSNRNGALLENQENHMLDFHSIIEERYFYNNEVLYVTSDDLQYNNVSKATYVDGKLDVDGKLAINQTALMVSENIDVKGDCINANQAVIYSVLGDVYINANNFSMDGLIYAPFGTVYIKSGNVNLNGAIVAQKIEIDGEYSVNLNKNDSFMKSFGLGKVEQTEWEEDEDLLDIGQVYCKKLTLRDDIMYDPEGFECVKNQLLLTAAEGVDYSVISELALQYQAEIVGYIEITNDYQIEFIQDMSLEDMEKIAEQFANLSCIEDVTFNLIIEQESAFLSNDTKWGQEWSEESPSGNNWGIEAIKLESALINMGVIENANAVSSSATTEHLYNVKIGLLDTAFDEWHRDLEFTKVWNNYESLEELQKKDFGHGTHVAGIMGALFNNSTGITGVCVKNRLYGFALYPDKDPEIVGKSGVFQDKCATAMMIGNNVKVINISMGYGDIAFGASQGVKSAIKFVRKNAQIMDKFLIKLLDKGYDFLIVMAAGNENDKVYYKNPDSYAGYVEVSTYGKADNPKEEYPNVDTSVTYGAENSSATEKVNDVDAKYNYCYQFSEEWRIKSRVVCVGAVKQPDSEGNYEVAKSSNVGKRVDILAPGAEIYSCSITSDLENDAEENYMPRSGTSMAAPHVAGTLGLAYSVYPGISATRLKGILKMQGTEVANEKCDLVNAANVVGKTKELLTKLTTSGLAMSTSQYNGIAIGRVLDENGKGIKSVRVTAVSCGQTDTNPKEYIVRTDSEGQYEMILPAGEYQLLFEASGYRSAMMYYTSVQEIVEYLDAVKLFDEKWYDSIPMKVSGNVRNAMDGTSVEGATIKFREGWNSKRTSYVESLIGEKQVVTDRNGDYSVKLPAGIYTAEIVKEGYVTAYVNMIASPDVEVQYAAITPILGENEYRIVLTWGDTPRDLDSHLVGTIDGQSYHVFYGDKSFEYNGVIVAQLDWDDTSGYGPETVTLTWKENYGDCQYYVYDFTNRGNVGSMELSYSSAQVTVYKGNRLLGTYRVPIGQAGIRWDVFEINNGALTYVNKIAGGK